MRKRRTRPASAAPRPLKDPCTRDAFTLRLLELQVSPAASASAPSSSSSSTAVALALPLSSRRSF